MHTPAGYVLHGRLTGVTKFVLFSGPGEDGALRGEQAVRNSGVDWSIVRASWFSQNFSEHFFLEPVLAGEVAFPAGQMIEPFIAVEDVAEVAAEAFLDDRHTGQLYEVTGPRLLTFGDAIGEIAKATGRETRYVPVSGDEICIGDAGAWRAGEFRQSAGRSHHNRSRRT